MDEQTRRQLSIINTKIIKLESEKERILQSVELTTKEHYEFYHG